MPSLPEFKPKPWKVKTEYKKSEQQLRIASQVYHTNRWRKLRVIQLNKEPLCVECRSKGRVTAATIADHIIPIHEGGRIWDENNIQSLCESCHNRKRQKERN